MGCALSLGMSTTKKAPKLTAAQRAMLTRMAGAPLGYELCPGGYPNAGRDAASWWRTVDVLVRRGFVRAQSHEATITPAGRAALDPIGEWGPADDVGDGDDSEPRNTLDGSEP